MIAIAMCIMLVLGWFARWSYDKAMFSYQEHEHEKEKEFMWGEIKRLRIQAAELVGKECRCKKST